MNTNLITKVIALFWTFFKTNRHLIKCNKIKKKACKLNTLRVPLARLSQKSSGGHGNVQQKKNKLTGEYKSSDYYAFNEYTYFDIEKEMVKYRQPQPSSLPKIEYTWSQTPPTIKKK